MSGLLAVLVGLLIGIAVSEIGDRYGLNRLQQMLLIVAVCLIYYVASILVRR